MSQNRSSAVMEQRAPDAVEADDATRARWRALAPRPPVKAAMDLNRNRLAEETSPYLLQHKDNPVHWQGWSPAVLAAAKEAGKPVMLSIGLFWWEFNVRASTVLGVVGAGGIGQELKNSMDLLDFPRLLTILVIILAMVTVIDHASQWVRRRLE